MQGLEKLEFRDRLGRRLVRCVVGLAVFAVGISMQMNANIGAPPWDVFHQGVAKQTGVSVGRIIVITGFALLFFWIPLRQKPGLGTILNALEIGLVADIALAVIPEPSNILIRVAMALVGIVVVAVGTGLYIGSALGPGPRDGLMTGLAQRGIPIRVGRTVIEVTVLVVGFMLG
ncbi:MAG: YczE/YyaS/YitT family protein, partial [Actinomycetota bacterium]